MLYRAENYSNDNDINRICTAAESRRNRYLKAEREREDLIAVFYSLVIYSRP